MSTPRVLVYGASGHGKVVADVARAAGLEVVGFVDDAPGRQGSGPWGIPVLSWPDCVARREALGRPAVALGIGDNATREKVCARVTADGFEVATPVHPGAAISPHARIGTGTVVMALVAVNPDAEVGPGAILNTGCVVEHDCQVGAFAHLSPNVALGGGVRVGHRAHLGLGAVVLPMQAVGPDARVGAGAVVTRHVDAGTTVVGVPARVIARDGAPGRNR